MRRLTASQKIAQLEHRIARLEKEASWTDYFGRFPRVRSQVVSTAKMIELLFRQHGMYIKLSKLKREKETLYGEKMVSLTYTFPLDGQMYKLRFLAAQPSLLDEYGFWFAEGYLYSKGEIALGLRFEKSGKASKEVNLSGRASFRNKAPEILKAFESVR